MQDLNVVLIFFLTLCSSLLCFNCLEALIKPAGSHYKNICVVTVINLDPSTETML